MAVGRWGSDILRGHRACPVNDTGSTCAPERFLRRRSCGLRWHFCRLNPDPDDAPLPLKTTALCRTWGGVAPTSRGNWGRRPGPALTIESRFNLTALDAPQCEVGHTLPVIRAAKPPARPVRSRRGAPSSPLN